MGDRYGRRAAYQINLLIFGLASLARAFAPSMEWLIGARLDPEDAAPRQMQFAE
jgi:putative MFS transporter